MGQISHLEQVKLDAERITKKRIREAAEEKAWQESKEGGVALGEAEEALASSDVYSTRLTKNGRTQYVKNGKLTSKAEYEANVK